jgi:hypothetical protein
MVKEIISNYCRLDCKDHTGGQWLTGSQSLSMNKEHHKIRIFHLITHVQTSLLFHYFKKNNHFSWAFIIVHLKSIMLGCGDASLGDYCLMISDCMADPSSRVNLFYDP